MCKNIFDPEDNITFFFLFMCKNIFDPEDNIKGVISKFWNFLYYWSDLTEIFTQYVKLNKKHFLFLNIFPFRA